MGVDHTGSFTIRDSQGRQWPLGVITAIYPGERGVIRTAEVEEGGSRTLRSVMYLVPLELDCHHTDDSERQRLLEGEGGDSDERRNLTSPAGALGHNLPPDASPTCRTSGSSRVSCPPVGTTEQCNVTTEGDTGTPYMLPSPLSPNQSVQTQTSQGEESEAGAGEPIIRARQPRRAAQQQRNLMESLLREDLLKTHLPLEFASSYSTVMQKGGGGLTLYTLFFFFFITELCFISSEVTFG